jgi:membrane protease YdiL (CAAX protease family)
MESRLVGFRIPLFLLAACISVGLGFFFSPALASVLGLLLITVATRFTFPSPVLQVWGLPLEIDKAKTFLLALFSAALSYFAVRSLMSGSLGLFHVEWHVNWLAVCLTVLLQSLLEEILFRGILLRRVLMKSHLPFWIVIVLAGALFSLAHAFNYFLAERFFLSPTTLFTLFFMAIAGNLMVVLQGHLFGAWGYHAGWNMLRFSSLLTVSGQTVGEGESFNLIEGSWGGLGVASLLLVAVVCLFLKKVRVPLEKHSATL